MCWLYQLVKSSSHQWGGILNWEHTSLRLGCRQAWRACFLLVINVGGPSQLVGAILGLEDLSSIRKQAEDAMGSKPVSSSHPWPLHQLLPQRSCPAWVLALTIFDSELLDRTVNEIHLVKVQNALTELPKDFSDCGHLIWEALKPHTGL